ncbi:MAG: FtsX-like permease family protein [Candidatus Lokiarchaeota archaeon]|nr:FtsX-like permease family protein [Candidatus Lokiarchaeota archaeon]
MLEKGFIKLGFRNSFRRKRTTAFTLVSIIISVGLLYTALSASANLQANANSFIQDSFTPSDVSVTGRYQFPITPEIIQTIQDYPEVENVVPRIEEWAWQGTFGSDIVLFLVAIDLDLEAHLGQLNVTEGVLDLDRGCLITPEAKEILNQSVGETLQLHTTSGIFFTNITSVGTAIDKGVFGPIVFISLETAWDVFPSKYPGNSTNKALVELYDIFSFETVRNRIHESINEEYQVINLKSYPTMLASNFLTQTRVVLFGLVLASIFIASFRVFASFVSILKKRMYENGVMMAFGADNQMIIQAILAEVGIIGLIGSILGCIFGAIFGLVVLNTVTQLQNIFFSGPSASIFSFSVFVDPVSLLIAGIIGLAITIISGYAPAISATKQPIARNLIGSDPFKDQYESESPSRTLRISYFSVTAIAIVIVGVVVLQLLSDITETNIITSDALRIASIPSFLLLAIVISPYVVRSNKIVEVLTRKSEQSVKFLASRNLRRNTLSALISFNLFCAVTVMFIASTNVGIMVTESWKQSVGYQTTPANVVSYFDPPADLEIMESIRAFPEVESATPVNQHLFLFHGPYTSFTGFLISAQPEGFGQVASISVLETANETEGLEALNTPLTCFISQEIALDLDVGLGDKIETSNGYNLTIVGICSSSIAIYVVSIINPLFVITNTETWEIVRNEEFRIGNLLVSSNDPNLTLNRLTEFHGSHPVLVSTILADYETALFNVEQIVNSSLVALLLVTFASTLLSSWSIASSRRREIGMLSAFGMSRHEIALTLTVESGSSFISGVLVGCIVGFFVQATLLRIISRIAGNLFVLISPSIIIIILLSVMISVLGSYLAVGKVTQENVIHLLREGRRSE